MKILALSTLVVLSLLGAGCSRGKPAEAVVDDTMVKVLAKCRATARGLPNVSEQQVEKFCSCSADKLLASIGTAGLRKMSESEQVSDSDKLKAKAAALACRSQLGKS